MKKLMNLLGCLLGLSLPTGTLFALELELKWSLENVFEMPESAVYDFRRNAIYVSNVNVYAKDSNGYISRVSVDGDRVEQKWLTGFNSPTGVAIFENFLYFADYDALIMVDLDTEIVAGRFIAPDKNPSLNDVAVSADGVVYVSGSRSRKIYRLIDGELKTLVTGKELLKNANGLLVEGDWLVHGGLTWHYFDRHSGKQVDSRVQPDSELKNFDGITADGQGGFFVTLIDDARVWHIKANGESVPLSSEKLNGIDLHYQAEISELVIPQVGGGLSVFRVIQPMMD